MNDTLQATVVMLKGLEDEKETKARKEMEKEKLESEGKFEKPIMVLYLIKNFGNSISGWQHN